MKSKDDFELFDGDEVAFFGISDIILNIVTIKGNVQRPGKYELKPGMTLNDLIQRSDGLLGDTFMERAEVLRTNFNENTSIYFNINLNDALEGNADENITLHANDVVTVYNKSACV